MKYENTIWVEEYEWRTEWCGMGKRRVYVYVGMVQMKG
jgi:hypothetical protein